MDTILHGKSKTVTIGSGQPFCIIGERINPTGRKKLAEELRGGDLSTVELDTHAQVEAGADMLDINAGIPLVDEAELLAKMLQTVQAAADIPICIDSSVIEALEAGLAVYEGKALVNSVTGEDERMEEILPLVAKHGAAVIGLANDETGIPETPQQRLEIATKIVSVAGDHGIPPEDVVIDPLAMTVGADTEAVTTTLETIRLIRDNLGVNMCLGASNVSFGLPERFVLNAAFLPMAMAAGLTSAIMSTAEVCVQSVRAADLLLGHDAWGANWIAAHRAPAGGPCRAVSAPSGGRAASPESASPLRAGRSRGPRSVGHAHLRRGELERHRDRLDVRRPRDVQEVQGADRRRRRAREHRRPARVQPGRAARRLAARLPRARARGPDRARAAAADAAEGGAGRRRPARDPAARGAEAPPRARGAHARGPALGRRSACSTRSTTWSRTSAWACSARSARRCARRSSTSPPSCATRS